MGAHNLTTSQAVHETSLGDEKMSTEMVVDLYHYCHRVCSERIMQHHVGPIARPGITVDIDESKFGKMKHHPDGYREGQWVFGGICHETYLVLAEHRDKYTLLTFIHAHILRGTCVMSDMWKAYECLQDEGYNHLTLNMCIFCRHRATFGPSLHFRMVITIIIIIIIIIIIY